MAAVLVDPPVVREAELWRVNPLKHLDRRDSVNGMRSRNEIHKRTRDLVTAPNDRAGQAAAPPASNRQDIL